MERGSDKHGPRLDVGGMARAGRTTHAEESNDPEPSGEAQPDVDRAPDAPLAGGIPEGTDEADIEGRSELAAALGKEVWPARADALRARASESAAPDRVLDLLAELPGDRTYRNVQEVWSDLGGGAEQHRF